MNERPQQTNGHPVCRVGRSLKTGEYKAAVLANNHHRYNDQGPLSQNQGPSVWEAPKACCIAHTPIHISTCGGLLPLLLSDCCPGFAELAFPPLFPPTTQHSKLSCYSSTDDSTAALSGGCSTHTWLAVKRCRRLITMVRWLDPVFWGHVCPARPRHATFALAVPLLTPDLPSPREAPPSRPEWTADLPYKARCTKRNS